MSELNLTDRVRALHIHEENGYGPGDCHCEACVETMDILKSLDGLPSVHLLKLGGPDEGWSMEHPLACRIELDARGLTLHDCELHQQVQSILREGRLPSHLVPSTYEVEYHDTIRVRKTLGGGGAWWPLREEHDPTSESFRST